jgi:nucleoside-diphosphate-sugar epimerase
VKALVTGASGFVGRHMAAGLERRGWQVRRCDLALESSWYSPDVRDIVATCESVHDLVVHCAYHVGGRAGIDGEPLNLARNLELDAAMFGWACRTGQRAVLYYSSSAAYPVSLQQGARVLSQIEGSPLPNVALQPHWLREPDIDLDAPEKPDGRYGWAKLTGEQLARAAGLAGLRVHVVRPFSGYGEDQDADEYPFPAIVRRVLSGDYTVWGPPGQCRDWIHIDDVVAASLAVVEADYRGPVNLCSGEPTEFGNLAVRIGAAAGLWSAHGARPDIEYLLYRPTGVGYRVGDPTLMRQFWRPRVSLDEGIARAVAGMRR